MGEPDQVIAKPDEVEEKVEGLHPPSLKQQNPRIITNTISTDPDILLTRNKALDEARQRLQDRYNKAVRENLEKKKVSGQDHPVKDKSSASVSPNKTSQQQSSSSSSSSSAKIKPAKKPRLRPEYNPLTGDTGASSSCSWKPTRRGGAAGGG